MFRNDLSGAFQGLIPIIPEANHPTADQTADTFTRKESRMTSLIPWQPTGGGS